MDLDINCILSAEDCFRQFIRNIPSDVPGSPFTQSLLKPGSLVLGKGDSALIFCSEAIACSSVDCGSLRLEPASHAFLCAAVYIPLRVS